MFHGGLKAASEAFSTGQKCELETLNSENGRKDHHKILTEEKRE